MLKFMDKIHGGNNMKYILMLNNQGIATNTGINHIGELFPNEVEITEEQFNIINEENSFPLKLKIVDGKVISWEKTVIEYEPIPEQPKEPTVEDYLIDLDFRVSMIELGLEV